MSPPRPVPAGPGRSLVDPVDPSGGNDRFPADPSPVESGSTGPDEVARRHREPGGASLRPGRCRERYPARGAELAPAGSRSRVIRGNRSSGRRATATLSCAPRSQRPRARRAVGEVGDGHRPCVPDRPRAPGVPAAEPVRPHRRVGAMRRDRALTRPTSCLPRIRPSASGTCPVVGTAHRFSCFRADGRRIAPIPRGRPIDTDREREAASCDRRHSNGRPRRRAGRDGGRVRLPRAARDPIRGGKDRRGRTGPRRQLPHTRWRSVPVSGCRPGPFPGERPDRRGRPCAWPGAAPARVRPGSLELKENPT